MLSKRGDHLKSIANCECFMVSPGEKKHVAQFLFLAKKQELLFLFNLIRSFAGRCIFLSFSCRKLGLCYL